MTHLRTRAVHAGQHPDAATGAISTPVVQTTAFGYGTLAQGAALFAGQADGYRYSRFANPTVAALEAKLADLEGAEAAVVFSSGTAACSSVLLGLLKPGDELVFWGPCMAAPKVSCAAWASAGASAWSMPRRKAWPPA